LFWTDALRDEGVRADVKEGKARMMARHLRVRDFFNGPNALLRFQDPVSIGATVSFDFRWLGPATDPSTITSPPGSSGRLFMSPVAGRWSAKDGKGFRFRSDPSGTTSVFGQLGHVRSGIFSH